MDQTGARRAKDMDTITYTELRANLAAKMDAVNDDHAPLLVTRARGKAAVLISAEDYAAVEETLYLLASPKNAERLREALEDAEAGRFTEHDLIEE